MDEKDLLIFLTLAETGNLTRTAEKLYLAQLSSICASVGAMPSSWKEAGIPMLW